MKITNKNNRGFTLIEIVISIAIISIVGIAILGFYANSSQIIKEADIRERALMIAQQELEKTKALSYDNIDTTGYNNISGGDGFSDFEVKRTVNNINSTLKKITIEVRWDSKSIDLRSYISKRWFNW